jgi:hypothetical protein
MALAGFDQDAEAPDGWGTIHFDDRPSLPGYLPPEQRPQAQPDMRLAMSNPADVYASPDWQGSQGDVSDQIGAKVSRPDVGPIMSPAPEMPPEQQISPAPQQVYSQGPAVSEMPKAPVGPPASAAAGPAVPRPTSPVAPPRAPMPVQPAPQQQPGQPVVPKGMQLASQSVTSTDAQRRITPEEQAARAEMSLNQSLTRKEIADRTAYNEAMQAKAIGEQLPELRQQVAEQQRAREQVRAEYRAKRQAAQAEVDEAVNKKVDPNKFYSDRGVLGSILVSVAQALGAYGATLGRTPNFAQKIIDDAINNDIATQRHNIEQKGLGAKNKLSELMQSYNLDIDEASSMLRSSQQQLADRQTMALAHATKSQDIIDNYNTWYADRQAQRVEQGIAEENAAEGKLSKKLEYRKPTGTGGPGGTKLDEFAQKLGYPTYSALAADDAAKKKANPDHTWNDTVRDAAEAVKAKGGGGPGGDIKVSPRLQGMLVKDKTINETAKERAAQYGLVRGEDGKWTVPSILGGAAQWATSAAGEKIGTPGAAGRRATRETIVDERASAAAQGKPDAETMQVYRHQESTNNPWAIAAQLNEAERAGKAQEEAIVDTAKRSRVSGVREDDDEERGR